jgi:F0F1-type ATP synthase assembly protein I
MVDNKPIQAPWWQPGLILFSKLSAWIIGPVILAVFFGRFLDEKFGTKPWMLLGAVSISFIFSIVIIIRTGVKEMEDGENPNYKDQISNKIQKK